MHNVDQKKRAVLGRGPRAQRSKTTPRSAGDETVRLSRLAPFVLLAVAGLIGLGVLMRMMFPRREAKRAGVAESVPQPKGPGMAPRPWPIPEHIFIEQAETGASGPHSTVDILNQRGPDCLDCAQRNGCLTPATEGGNCEEAVGLATGCGPAVTEKDICLKTLQEVFASKCAETFQETPCLCGATDTMACLSGTATPTGPLYSEYACDFRTADAVTIQQKFVQREFGVGQANALIQCAGGFECKCFGN